MKQECASRSTSLSVSVFLSLLLLNFQMSHLAWRQEPAGCGGFSPICTHCHLSCFFLGLPHCCSPWNRRRARAKITFTHSEWWEKKNKSVFNKFSSATSETVTSKSSSVEFGHFFLCKTEVNPTSFLGNFSSVCIYSCPCPWVSGEVW